MRMLKSLNVMRWSASFWNSRRLPMATHEMAVQADAMHDFDGTPEAEELVNRVLLFGRYLKALGFQVTPSRMLDVCRSLGYMDITRREDFHDAARVNLVSHRDELPLFEEAFKNF